MSEDVGWWDGSSLAVTSRDRKRFGSIWGAYT